MPLQDGYTDVPRGKIASVVTHLEMLAPPPGRSAPCVPGGAVRAVIQPDTEWYRDLYRRVGAMDWLWFSRLQMETAELEAIVCDPKVELFALTMDGADEGLLELDFRKEGECELAFFGVTGNMIGKGAGRLLMSAAIAAAWTHPITRFWVHTCTWDHPNALGFYMRSGFQPHRLQIEVADDPRLNGILPQTAAPQVPIIRP